MNLTARTAAVIATTLLLTILLLLASPFAVLNHLLDRAFGAAPEWTQVTTLRKSETLHEITSGEFPHRSLTALAHYWSAYPGRPRVIFFGNSQAQSMSLAPGEAYPGPGEKTYFDHLADRLSGTPPERLLYRLSAGALSYSEALWYTLYLLSQPEVKPDVLVLQLNYQAFYQGTIREGMYDLLAEPAFRDAVDATIASDPNLADTLRQAVSAYRAQAAKAKGQASVPGGARLESAFRSRLDRLPLFRARRDQKVELLGLLYRFRLYLLQLKPSTARSISGARLVRSRAALEAIARLCRDHQVRLVLFYAPLNPRVNLYQTAEDERSYHDFADDLARRYQLPLYNLENRIPAGLWGRYYNSPDPLHLGREGHKLMADLLEEPVLRSLGEK